MNLADHLHDDLSDVHADAAALHRTAVTGGTRVRRRRRVRTTALTGLAAAAVAGIVTASALLPGGGDGVRTEGEAGVASAPTAAPTPSAAPTSAPAPVQELVPITGRMTIAALQDAIAALPEGLAIRGELVPRSIEGTPDGDPVGDSYGTFDLTGGAGDVAIGVNVQRWSSLDLPDPTCGGSYLECTVTMLDGGDVLRTYRLDDGKDVDQRFAEVVSPDRDLRVIIAASVPLGAPEPVSFDQLAAVATWPTWALELPSEYVDAGAALPWFNGQPG